MNDIWEVFNRADIDEDKKIYIYNINSDSLAIFFMSINMNICIEAFACDASMKDVTILNKRVISMDEIEKDAIILISVSERYKNFDAFLKRIYVNVHKLQKTIIESRNVYIYGAGNNGRITKNILEKQGVHISGFIDSNTEKIGSYIDKCIVYSIYDIYKDVVIIISSLWYKEIYKKVKKKGYKNIFIDYGTIANVEYPYIVVKSLCDKNNDILWEFMPRIYNLERIISQKRRIFISQKNGYGYTIKNILKLMSVKAEFINDIQENTVDKNDSILLLTDIITDTKKKLLCKEVDEWEEKGWERVINLKSILGLEIWMDGVWDVKQYGGYLDPLLGYTIRYPQTSKEYDQYVILGNPQSERVKVMVLGNSVSDIGEFSNTKIWIEYLYEKLKREVCIFGGAIGAYSVRQECLKLIRDIENIKPHYVIVLDGICETVDMSVPEHPFLHWYHLKAFESIRSKKMSMGIESQESSSDLWIRLQKTMKSIAEISGAEYIGCLQPTIFSKKYLTKEERKIRIYFDNEIVESKYSIVEKRFFDIKERCNKEKIEGIYDISYCTDESNENVFLDYCHLTKKGNEIVANAIYEILYEKMIGKYI